MKTIVGLYVQPEGATKAAQALEGAGFSASSVRVLRSMAAMWQYLVCAPVRLPAAYMVLGAILGMILWWLFGVFVVVGAGSVLVSLPRSGRWSSSQCRVESSAGCSRLPSAWAAWNRKIADSSSSFAEVARRQSCAPQMDMPTAPWMCCARPTPKASRSVGKLPTLRNIKACPNPRTACPCGRVGRLRAWV